MKILRVRLDEQLGTGLDRLKTERHVNVSSWVRSLIRPALDEQLSLTPEPWGRPRNPRHQRPRPPVPPSAPLPGWRPWSLEDGSWGSRFDGDTRALPDDLVGRVIEVTTKGGDSWTTTVVEVIQLGGTSPSRSATPANLSEPPGRSYRGW